MKKFPALEWVARNGRKLSVAVGVAVLLGGIGAALLCQTVLGGVAAAVAAVASWAVLRVAVEVVEVVAETLLPR